MLTHYHTLTLDQKKAQNTELKEVKVSIEYNIGGYNYFSDVQNPRGYRVAFKPMTRLSGGGAQSIILGAPWESGLAFMLEETKRKNDKVAIKWAEKIDLPHLAALYADNQIQAIRDYLQSITK